MAGHGLIGPLQKGQSRRILLREEGPRCVRLPPRHPEVSSPDVQEFGLPHIVATLLNGYGYGRPRTGAFRPCVLP